MYYLARLLRDYLARLVQKLVFARYFFLRRNIVFERLRLLGRVFADDRLKIVLKALEEGGYG